MYRNLRLAAIVSGAILLMGGAAAAGQFADFETQLRAAYAPYRAVLFQTNKKDQAASEQALAKFSSAWNALVAGWVKAPPPQYAGDADFAASLGKVTSHTEQARAAILKTDLADAHEILEKIRDVLGDLRSRNGIINFSDRMNAYHEAMEHILTNPHDGFDPNGMGLLREDASVLAYLYRQIDAHRPSYIMQDAEFSAAMRDVKMSVDNLMAATRAADPAAAQKAVKTLKQPYSVLFLKFG